MMMQISGTSTPKVKRLLRSFGMRECYTSGGANILYCRYTAFRLISEYCMEIWNPFETESGSITYYNSLAERNLTLLFLGLESLGAL
jgi:hypothetical protein